MEISLEETRHIASLARLHLDDEQAALMARQLGAILTYARQLDELDTAGVEPTAHVLDVTNVFRPDVAELLPHDRELMLGQAPRFEHGLYVVPRVIE
jgi:aspartyl-tRNA(Asn)/glutamyl-tRNA(Gln) amidotransferase subunit C